MSETTANGQEVQVVEEVSQDEWYEQDETSNESTEETNWPEEEWRD